MLFAAIFAIAGISAHAQDATGTVAVATEATPAAVPAPKPASFGVPEGRMFFPHNWLRGYAGFDVAPSHNDPDLGRCSQSQTVIVSAGGANSNCNAYARYLLSGYLEVQPFGKTLARHIFVFFTPTFSFGNNVPQLKYTASMAGIAYERAVGIGIELPKNFEFRVTCSTKRTGLENTPPTLALPTSARQGRTVCTRRSARGGILEATVAHVKDASALPLKSRIGSCSVGVL